MDIFYDCEFVERGPEIPIQLVSIGMVRGNDGAEFYGINQECLSNVVRHPWTSINVLPHLPIRLDDPTIFEWDKGHPEYDNVYARDILAGKVLEFITEANIGAGPVKLWADFGAYDHVVLCQLVGSMADLPAGVPMYTGDIQQLLNEYPLAKLPPDDPDQIQHHALHDARWAARAYRIIRATYAPVKLTGPITLALEAGDE